MLNAVRPYCCSAQNLQKAQNVAFRGDTEDVQALRIQNTLRLFCLDTPRHTETFDPAQKEEMRVTMEKGLPNVLNEIAKVFENAPLGEALRQRAENLRNV